LNYQGSYRALRDNANAAMMAAIEIYNKPNICYRDECTSILIINAWELLLKAIISKSKQSIYYPKERNKPYRTLSIGDSLSNSKPYFPPDIPFEPVAKNIDLLLIYRNNSTHFYNQKGFSALMYPLMQTSIMNFRDIMLSIFQKDMKDLINIVLLPLSLGVSLDPIEFFKKEEMRSRLSKAVTQYVSEVARATKSLESEGFDTTRLLMTIRVKLESTKKYSSADIIAGISKEVPPGSSGPLIIERRFDPNDPNWMRQKDILKDLPEMQGIKINQFVFQSLIWKYDIKEKQNMCWIADEGCLIKYSNEIIAFIKKLSAKEIKEAIADYKTFMKNNKRK
jgi:hypothetical protein